MSKLTRKAITEAFLSLLRQKSLDKITVKDIIETAGVNRNTFYYHYRDIYDLLEKLFLEETERYESECPPESSFHEEYLRAAGFFRAHREAIVHLYNSKSRDILYRYVEHTVSLFVARFVRQAAAGTGISENGIGFITHFYAHAIIGATMLWVEDRLPDAYSDDLLLTISRSFEATVDDMIRSWLEGHPGETAEGYH